MQSLRVAIVEDEAASVRRLQSLLQAMTGVDLVGVAGDGDSGLHMVRDLKPDAVFLDISMPGMDGIGVARALSLSNGPEIVFATAHAEFAVQAFDLSAVDYVLKPVEAERVASAIERARARIRASSAEERAGRLQMALHAMTNPPGDGDGPISTLWVTDGRGRTRLELSAVERLEADRDYVRIHAGERAYLIRTTLQALCAKLDGAQFIRIHRSAAVRLSSVRGLRRRITGSIVAQLASGVDAPVGRAYLNELRTRLGLVDPA